jgi:ferritin
MVATRPDQFFDDHDFGGFGNFLVRNSKGNVRQIMMRMSFASDTPR